MRFLQNGDSGGHHAHIAALSRRCYCWSIMPLDDGSGVGRKGRFLRPVATQIVPLLTRLTESYVPSAFSIACILTVIVFAAGVLVAGHSPYDCLLQWGQGFWVLLTFAMQMSLMLVTGYMVALSPWVDRLLEHLAGLPRTPRQSVVAMAITSMLFAWIHWGLGLVVSSVFLRYLVRRHPEADYRVMVAVAYLGLGATWHAGLSASAPLLSATPGHILENEIGVVPLSETVFSPFNLTLSVVVIVVLAAFSSLLQPTRKEDRFLVPTGTLDQMKVFEVPQRPARRSFATMIDYGYGINLVIGLAGTLWLLTHFATSRSQEISINTINFFFLVAAILLHPSPASLGKAAEEGVRFIHGIVIQFPLYAGIYGIIQGTGLSEIIGRWFVSVATQETFPMIVYWYSGFLNYFVPSGGSKWVIEAPYLISAAETLSVTPRTLLVSYAWGDMMTNLLQPFWCIPLLAAAKIEFREILGYGIILFFVYATICSFAFFWFPPQ